MIAVAGCETTSQGRLRSSTTQAKVTEQKKQMKQVTTQKLPNVLKKDYSQYPTKYNSWWFKRQLNHTQSGADETVDLTKYDAFYVDKKCANGDKIMYLTFDCGYDNGYTEKMLDILKAHKAKACFFVTQTYIRDNIDLVKRMKKEGHLVGNHTITHPDLTKADIKKMKHEVKGCEKYMKEATGYPMDLYFRPPKGEYNEKVLQIAKDLGYKTVFWSMAYLDYDVNNQPGTAYVVEHFKKYHHPGAIPLLHNVSKSNAEALEEVITYLEGENYKFEGLDHIM